MTGNEFNERKEGKMAISMQIQKAGVVVHFLYGHAQR
jgi:hypothetical protein